jgi:cytidyltransferase-like protein
MQASKKIIVLSGGFDPVHSGHIKMCNSAKTYGDYLIVGVNSDAWLTRKKGQPFMPWDERAAVIRNLKAVDEVMAFNDDDGSACDLLEKVKAAYPGYEIIFGNGGDRTPTNIPEMRVEGIEFQFGVGGEDKANSSSWILQEWKAPKTERQWGYYRVLHEVSGTKVKELTVEPGQSLSMQKHQFRAEYWHVSHGACIVHSRMDSGYTLPSTLLKEHMYLHIPVGEWHQLVNPYDVPCKIVEIQYGAKCIEEDIERLVLDK